MREEALQYVGCPVCKCSLDVAESTCLEGDHVISGALTCRECARAYPIVNGVPRLLSGETRNLDVETGKSFARFFGKVAPGGSAGNDVLYGLDREAEIQDFLAKTRLTPEQLRDKVLLDAGCGLARLETWLAASCRAVVAFDITPRVEEAFRYLHDVKNVHIVQGDLLAAPALPGVFDIVFCDGALPYVSSFRDAVRELTIARAPTGYLSTWVYSEQKSCAYLVARMSRLLPMGIRFLAVKCASLLLCATASVIRREDLLPRAGRLSEAIFDLSLVRHVNRIALEEIRLLLAGHDADLASERGTISIRIGDIGASNE